MNFPYCRLPGKPSKAFPKLESHLAPLIPVRLSARDRSVDVHALIDSGTENCLFPAEIGELVGLRVREGKEHTFRGLGQAPVVAHFHEVDLTVGTIPVRSWVGFTYEGLRVPLLGQQGFFEHFRVTFDLPNETIVIRPKGWWLGLMDWVASLTEPLPSHPSRD